MNCQELLDENLTIKFLQVGSVKTLQRWRVMGYGPPFIKIGHRVRYVEGDLIAWLESQRRKSTSDKGANHG